MDSDKTVPQTTQQSSIEYKKTADFAHSYANNVFLESSLWDLKLVFGQNDQQLGPNVVVQHNAITIPWAQIKVLAYFLKNHLAAHEIANGRIIIPPNLIPVVTGEVPKDFLKDNPKLPEIVATFKANYDAFIAANPEAAPIRHEPMKSKK